MLHNLSEQPNYFCAFYMMADGFIRECLLMVYVLECDYICG